MRSVFSDVASAGDLSYPPAACGHHVQFYEDDGFLAETVAEFLATGLRVGQPSVVIATEPHRVAFGKRLRDEGIDVDAVTQAGLLTMLDAHAMLDLFMVGSVPNTTEFKTLVGNIIAMRTQHAPKKMGVRLYGEMVDILWRDGNTNAALRLEELWNELGRQHAFSLMCAYAMPGFYKASDTHRFEEICRVHGHVVPTERFVRASTDTRLHDVSVLQQRALALEAEVAARREAEERLQERERDLRQLLAEREQLLTRERAARMEAEAANRAKSDFLAMMSHELRTPLNAIAGHIQLIAMEIHGPVSRAQREALARVDRSQRHLLSLINEVLNLTRIETGRVNYTLENFAVAPLLAEIAAMLEPMILTSRLTYEMVMALPASVVPITARADRERTHQIVVNLMTNAIKFTPPGGRIRVELASGTASCEQVCIRVTDTGIGIADSKLEHIFEPFVQVGSSSREGVGLGLAISRDLARGMGGDVVVQSTVGVGTTFTLTVPAV